MTLQTATGADIATAVLLACLHQRGQDRPTTREVRGVAIAASFSLRRERRDWYVQSRAGDREYRIRNGACPCKDDRHCKHLIAVDLLADYAAELVRRLGRNDEWDGTVEDVQAMHGEYVAMLQAASSYAPPADGLLYAFRLESVGDDAWQRQRQARLSGHLYTPSRVRDLHPERPWVAHINGLCPRYEFHRGFLRGRVDYREADKRGSRGVYLYFGLPPGIYEVYERQDHYRSRRYFARVADLAMPEISKREALQWLAGRS